MSNTYLQPKLRGPLMSPRVPSLDGQTKVKSDILDPIQTLDWVVDESTMSKTLDELWVSQEKRNQPEKLCVMQESPRQSRMETFERQVSFLRESYPTARVVKDIGSGLNWNRKGFKLLLESVHSRSIAEVVVSDKDRLCRFGFELVEWIFNKPNVKLVVLNGSPGETDYTKELSDDLISITTVFVARHHGLRAGDNERRRNKQLQENQSLSEQGTETDI